MDFKSVAKKYRPIPFWSWNERLDIKETTKQIHLMHDVGLGGFFMHARGGLQTEYMGEEWFENVEASIETARKCEMGAWAYDENGWPSGFGSGAVNGMGIEYQQKYLRMSDTEPDKNIIGKSGEHWFYYEVNPFYVDTLDKKVIAEFIKTSYEPYYERFGNRIEGFFTDEPQISRNGIPWSFVFENEYKERYSQNITDYLEELFLPIGDYKNTRVQFWKMVTDLFSSAFMKQIYEWCNERGLKLTGHLVLEETLECQLTTNGACMPHYEYMHIPGMDWLGRDVFDCLTPKQVSSVCEQLGKEQVLSETFALCGHNVSFAQLKGIYEWQMVHGINLLCQHLEGYSLRGIRKRDYPPAMYYQQPWWCEYDKFNDAMSREGMILSKGTKTADVLVLHPQTTAWSLFDCGDNTKIDELNDRFLDTIKTLERKHIEYHLGDETIMERHAKVENGRLIVGKQGYSKVICENCEVLFENTKKLLSEFVQAGGEIVTADTLAGVNVIDNERITYTKRSFDGFNVHYFVNTSENYERAVFNISGKMLDIYSGDLLDFCGEHEFEPWGSLMLIEDGSENVKSAKEEPTYIRPDGDFEVIYASPNSLLLDRCDYYFDGELQEKNGYVLNIGERANVLERLVKIHQDYYFTAAFVPNELFMVCETPDIFNIKVNGKEIDKIVCGTFRDKSFKKIDISKYVKEGVNTISFDCDFVQSNEFYENRQKSFAFESEKNKLAYDMEIEAIYLIGDFAVDIENKWIQLERRAVRCKGDFIISKPNKTVKLQNLEKQGYPFFCGEIELVGKIEIYGENPVLELEMCGINAVSVEINGIKRTLLTNNRLALTDFGVRGICELRLKVVNNLRNLLGPHHLKIGESYWVWPGAFYRESCVWNETPEQDWDDGYSFCEVSI